MRKLIIGIALVGAGLGAFTIVSTNQEPQEDNTSVRPIQTVQATVTPAPEPIETPAAPVSPIESKQTTAPSMEPVQTEVTNERLIKDYRWEQSPNLESINFIISKFPEQFTPENRGEAFAYIKRVSDVAGGVAYIYNDLMTKQGITSSYWPRIGAKYGVQ